MPYKYVKNYVTRARYIAANSRRTASRSGRAAMVARFRNMKRYTVPKVLYRPKGNMSLRLPFPTKKTVTLRYVDNDTISLAPSTGKNVISSLSLLANSCYDPYAPLGGHQPMGFDQWAALYTMYTVKSCKIHVEGMIVATNVAEAAIPYTSGIGLFDNTTAGTVTSMCEDGRVKWTLARPGYSGTLPASKFVLDHYYDGRKFFGSDALWRQMSTAQVGSNPADAAIFQIFFGQMQTSITVGITYCYINFVLEYDVEFSEPKPTAQS